MSRYQWVLKYRTEFIKAGTFSFSRVTDIMIYQMLTGYLFDIV